MRRREFLKFLGITAVSLSTGLDIVNSLETGKELIVTQLIIGSDGTVLSFYNDILKKLYLQDISKHLNGETYISMLMKGGDELAETVE